MRFLLQPGIFRSVFAMMLTTVCAIVLMAGAAQAGGGTNGLLGRMETMINQMRATGEMTTEEAEEALEQVEELRTKVDERIQKNGGWINPVHDKDLYNLIDRYNKPIFDRYQNSAARKNSDPRQLGTYSKDNQVNTNTIKAPTTPDRRSY